MLRVASRVSSRIMDASLRTWAVLKDGRRVDAVTLKNANGLEVVLATYGATILSVKAPSKTSASPEELTLCYDNIEALMAKSPYYGSTVGRVANRIAKGKFGVGGDKVRRLGQSISSSSTTVCAVTAGC